MSALEVNKIIASIILALIIIFLISYVVNIFNSSEETKENSYLIEIPESDESQLTSNMLSESKIEPISSLLMNASLEKGEKIYKKCSSCHNYKKGSENKVGPQLWDLINRPKGNVGGFAYSRALIDMGGTWSYEELSAFLYKPKDYMPGTKMNFAGLKKAEDRANLILFLREQSENPVSLP